MRILPLLVFAACGGGSAPNANVTAATPDQLTPANDELDDLTITIAYDDGDGDLGGGFAEVHDCRGDGLVTAILIPAIAPPDVVGERIEGTLSLLVTDIGALAPDAQPELCRELGAAPLGPSEAVFCVVLVDAAENAGGGDCTQPIALVE
ncbi:MAG TPA: hypothetical protein VIU61_18690 [Kofleriaceae bacterium]